MNDEDRELLCEPEFVTPQNIAAMNSEIERLRSALDRERLIAAQAATTSYDDAERLSGLIGAMSMLQLEIRYMAVGKFNNRLLVDIADRILSALKQHRCLDWVATIRRWPHDEEKRVWGMLGLSGPDTTKEQP